MAPLTAAASDSRASQNALAHVRLWDAYAGAIYRYCFRRTGDTGVAEDLTSVVFLEAWRRRAEVSVAPDATLPWLYGVATNVLRNQRRSQRRQRAALARLPRPLDEPDFAERLTDRLDDEQRMRVVLGQLRRLSRLEQEVLTLCLWEGLTSQAAATALGIPEATVRTRLHRAREHLRALGESGPEAISTRRSDATQGELP